jgi:hypothetical protein
MVNSIYNGYRMEDVWLLNNGNGQPHKGWTKAPMKGRQKR